MTDAEELMEGLWEAEKEYGGRLSPAEQVGVARVLAGKPLGSLTMPDVQDAFRQRGLSTPPAGYARMVLERAQGLRPRPGLRAVLLEYRQFAIRSLSRQFGGRTKGREDELRNNLLTFLPKRGYTEAHTGRGQTDILIPAPEDAIIETKIWTAQQTYEDGLIELGRYIHTEKPKQAYMVIFGDRVPLPAIVNDHDQEIAAEPDIEGLTVPVIVVAFEVDQPSKAAQNARRRKKSDG